MHFRSVLLTAGLALTPEVPAQQNDYSVLTTPEEAAVFGAAVGLTEDRAIVAAPGSFGADRSGSVYVFEPQNGRWVLRARLTAGDGLRDQFGFDVAMQDGLILVGAPVGNGATARSGTAYLFESDGGWTKKVKLSAADGLEGDMFGCAVDLSRDRAVIGAMRWTIARAQPGVAYVFRSEGDEWVEQARLTAIDGERGDMFGESVAMDGQFVAVGAPRSQSEGGATGKAYVYRYEDPAWIEEARLVASDAADEDGFGWALSVDGDRLVVGALNAATAGPRAGAAYVFRRVGSRWIEEAKLTASDGAEDARFGSSVCIGEHMIVVGSFGRGGALPGGAAYVFARTETGWVERAKLAPKDVSQGDHLGISVSASGSRILVGAMGRDSDIANSGTAFIFELSHDLASGGRRQP